MEAGRFKTLIVTFTIAFIACLASMISGMWIGWSSPATYLMNQNQTKLQVTDFGMMIAMYDLGNIISPIPCGYLLAWLGRKPTICIIGPMNILGWLTMLMWPSRLDALYGARLLAGLAKGMVFSSIPMYVGEIAEVQSRGAALSLFPIMLTIGIIGMQMVGQLLSYDQLNMLGLAVSVGFTVLFLAMPETPYYLMQRDRRDMAQKSLQMIRAKDDVTDELIIVEETVTKQMQSKSTYSELFKNLANRKALYITAGASVFQRLSGVSPFLHFSSITLPGTNYWMNPLVAVVVFTAVKNFGNVFHMFVVDWVGRKPLMLVSHAAMAVFTAAYGVGLWLVASGPEGQSFAWLPVVTLWAYGMSYSLGAGSLTYTLIGEMFATNVKTKAVPLCVVCLATASFMLNGSYTIVSRAFGVQYNYYMYSAFNSLWIIIASFIMIETKGKTFLEIEQMLTPP